VPGRLVKHTSGYVWEGVSREEYLQEMEWHHPIGLDGIKGEK
jgi:hypothetical protein